MKLIAITFMLILGHIYGHPHTCDQQEACQGMLGALKWSVRAMRKFGEEFKFSIKEACMAFEITTKLSNKTCNIFLERSEDIRDWLDEFPIVPYKTICNRLNVCATEEGKTERKLSWMSNLFNKYKNPLQRFFPRFGNMYHRFGRFRRPSWRLGSLYQPKRSMYRPFRRFYQPLMGRMFGFKKLASYLRKQARLFNQTRNYTHFHHKHGHGNHSNHNNSSHHFHFFGHGNGFRAIFHGSHVRKHQKYHFKRNCTKNKTVEQVDRKSINETGPEVNSTIVLENEDQEDKDVPETDYESPDTETGTDDDFPDEQPEADDSFPDEEPEITETFPNDESPTDDASPGNNIPEIGEVFPNNENEISGTDQNSSEEIIPLFDSSF